ADNAWFQTDLLMFVVFQNYAIESAQKWFEQAGISKEEKNAKLAELEKYFNPDFSKKNIIFTGRITVLDLMQALAYGNITQEPAENEDGTEMTPENGIAFVRLFRWNWAMGKVNQYFDWLELESEDEINSDLKAVLTPIAKNSELTEIIKVGIFKAAVDRIARQEVYRFVSLNRIISEKYLETAEKTEELRLLAE
ncbi:MAG: hypothetical protein ACRC2T_00015, partial [Thermoguttaceae bacterium]